MYSARSSCQYEFGTCVQYACVSAIGRRGSNTCNSPDRTYRGRRSTDMLPWERKFITVMYCSHLPDSAISISSHPPEFFPLFLPHSQRENPLFTKGISSLPPLLQSQAPPQPALDASYPDTPAAHLHTSPSPCTSPRPPPNS